MKQPKILMFAPSILPPTNPEAIVNANLVAAGLDAGWQVDIIAQELANWYPINEDASDFNAVSKTINRIKVSQNQIVNFYSRLSSKKRLWSIHPLFGNSWIAPAITLGRALAEERQYDFIISRALPDYAHLPALNLTSVFGIPWIANWNDPAPLHIAPPPYGFGPSLYPVGFPVIKNLRRVCLIKYYKALSDKAVWHTFPCERLRNYMVNMLGSSILHKSTIIPHIMVKDMPMWRRQTTTSSKEFTLCHAGSLRSPRSPETFLRGVRKFIDTVRPKKPFVVKFIGETFENINGIAGELGLHPYVRSLAALPYRATLQLLADEAVLVIIEARMKEGIYLPSKFVDYVSVRRPILAVSPAVGTIADFLQKFGGGVATDVTSPDDVARGINLLYNSWEKNTLDDEYLSNKLYEEFMDENIINHYELLFNNLRDSKERRS